MKIRALLVDDEAPARSELRYLLARIPRSRSSARRRARGGARPRRASSRYDVVFLDVEMPGLTGVEAAPLVRERSDPPAVVFVTAHERYAVDAFAVEAFDYLLKPVDPDRLARVIERLQERSSRTPCPSRRCRSSRAAAPSCSTTTRCTTSRRTATTAACTPTTAPTSARRRSASSRSGSGRALRAHPSLVPRQPVKVAGVRRAAPDRFCLQLADAEHTELDVARRQSRQLRERLGL